MQYTDLDNPTETSFACPDFIGLVSGAQYKLENGDGVTEFALVFFVKGLSYLIETSAEDLKYLGRQIESLVGE